MKKPPLRTISSYISVAKKKKRNQNFGTPRNSIKSAWIFHGNRVFALGNRIWEIGKGAGHRRRHNNGLFIFDRTHIKAHRRQIGVELVRYWNKDTSHRRVTFVNVNIRPLACPRIALLFRKPFLSTWRGRTRREDGIYRCRGIIIRNSTEILRYDDATSENMHIDDFRITPKFSFVPKYLTLFPIENQFGHYNGNVVESTPHPRARVSKKT